MNTAGSVRIRALKKVLVLSPPKVVLVVPPPPKLKNSGPAEMQQGGGGSTDTTLVALPVPQGTQVLQGPGVAKRAAPPSAILTQCWASWIVAHEGMPRAPTAFPLPGSWAKGWNVIPPFEMPRIGTSLL